MSDDLQTENVRTLLAQMENDWQELKELLQARKGKPEASPSPVSPGLNQQGDAEDTSTPDKTGTAQPDAPRGSEIKTPAPMGAITSMEAEAIVQRVEKVHRDAEISERLARLERQNRRITLLGSMFLTILTLAMLVFAYLLAQTNLWDKTNLFHGLRAMVSAKAPGSESQGGKPLDKPSAEAPVKYVGSVTSNKYHYPDCKWAKQIAPSKLVPFKSVEEAKEEGYIPCPACKPPASDNPEDKGE